MRDRKKAQALAHELVSKMTIEERASQLKFDAPPVERLGVPAYNWWNEALHGVARAGTATMFPQPVAMASMFDPEMIRKIGMSLRRRPARSITKLLSTATAIFIRASRSGRRISTCSATRAGAEGRKRTAKTRTSRRSSAWRTSRVCRVTGNI